MRCSALFLTSDKQRALNTLRYIHANPQAAGMQQGFFSDFSNYGVYVRGGDDGLTTKLTRSPSGKINPINQTLKGYMNIGKRIIQKSWQ